MQNGLVGVKLGKARDFKQVFMNLIEKFTGKILKVDFKLKIEGVVSILSEEYTYFI